MLTHQHTKKVAVKMYGVLIVLKQISINTINTAIEVKVEKHYSDIIHCRVFNIDLVVIQGGKGWYCSHHWPSNALCVCSVVSPRNPILYLILLKIFAK